MLRYRLDDLGWYQFEKLIQSLLKAQFGSGIQSLGEHGDWGIDAFFNGELDFPSKYTKTKGSFIFQIKFVENANASGANPEIPLINSIRKEIEKLKTAPRYNWKDQVDHYIFITNARLSKIIRTKIKAIFSPGFPKANFYSYGGNDVCDLLDNNPQIRKAFPQLLSLRELDKILFEIVNKDIVTRSWAAIEQAKDVASIFIPTKSYKEAWQKLNKHKFVVLDGPPEVGKTAIALMIALIQLLDGWEAMYCEKPGDILQVYNANHECPK